MKRTERVAIEERTERRILETPMRQAFSPTRAPSLRQLPTRVSLVQNIHLMKESKR
jgi:hypothetical protein